MTGRFAALSACTVLAVIVNAAAIDIASKAGSRSPGVAALATEKPQRAVMVLVSAPDEPASPGVTRDVGTPSTPAETPLRPPTHVPTYLSSARTTPAPANTEPPPPVLFYPFREVDSPAFPPDDWNLDVESLDEIGVQRLVFEVLVSDRGEIVGCTVLDPPDLADGVKRSLEKRLSETPLLPALRAGQLVASARRIELTVADAPPEQQVEAPAHRP
jgi:hypothetical protein